MTSERDTPEHRQLEQMRLSFERFMERLDDRFIAFENKQDARFAAVSTKIDNGITDRLNKMQVDLARITPEKYVTKEQFEHVEKNYVTQDQFKPIRITYYLINALIIGAILTSVFSLVFKGPIK